MVGNYCLDITDMFLCSMISYTSWILKYFINLDLIGFILAACPAGEDLRLIFLIIDRGTDLRKWFFCALTV